MIGALRIAALLLATSFTLTACGGGGRSLLGGGPAGSGSGSPSGTQTGSGKVTMSISFSATGTASTSSAIRRPKTISSKTQSISVSVNGGAPQVFDLSSCTGTTTITCTLSVGAPYGLDSFLILMYSGTGGTGTALNAAAVTINVTQGGSNTASATAGNLLTVNSSADSSGGSDSCAGTSTTCTLREAIAEASTTAGVFTAIMFSNVSSITVASPITIDNQSIVVIGPGALVANTGGSGAPSASGNLKISGGGTSQIFYVTAGSLTIDGVTLTGGSSSDAYGGAIENYGTLSILNTIFNANGGSDTYYGGAVYDESSTDDTTAVLYSTFTGNTALTDGGAYYDDDGVSFSHCVFAGNYAAFQSDYGEGGAIYADWDLSVDSSSFTTNVAGSTTASGIETYGGAISIENGSQSPSITNSTFGGTTASLGNFAGGAGSSDDGYGGAIYNDSGQVLTLSGNTFANNVAKGGGEAYGGAISDYSGIASTGDTYASNIADGTAAGSDGYAEGGAIYSEAAISLTNATVNANAANAAYECNAGGIYDYDSTLALSSVQITNNTCSANNGTNNYAYAYGGGLEDDYSQISFLNVTISGNTASASASGSYYGEAYGGGFEYYAGYNACQLCSVTRRKGPAAAKHHATQNIAMTASAVQVRMLGDFKRAQTLKQLHMAKKSRHAAAALAAHRAPSSIQIASVRRIQSGTAPANGMDTVTFSNNTANGGANGGVAYGGGADLSGIPTFNAVSFTGNTATASGTNLYAAGGGISEGESNCVTNSVNAVVSGNSATNAGGGIFHYCGNLTVQNSTISGNKVTATTYAGDGGGGVWTQDFMTLTGCTLTGNSVAGTVADSGGGGLLAFDSYSASTTITNSTVFLNTAQVDGGGLLNAADNDDGSVVDITNSTIYQNTATTGKGGNGTNNANVGAGENFVYFQNTIIAGGSAPGNTDTNDVYNADTVLSFDYNLVGQQSQSSPGSGTCANGGGNFCAHDLAGTLGAPVNPQLSGALGSNGGPTQTLADTASSPGRGAIPFAAGACGSTTYLSTTYNGPSTDQRGYSRGAGGVCDIGAVEFAGTAP